MRPIEKQRVDQVGYEVRVVYQQRFVLVRYTELERHDEVPRRLEVLGHTLAPHGERPLVKSMSMCS